ncbi:hypothetical protein ACHAQJ_006077 [Trichoderma viride]
MATMSALAYHPPPELLAQAQSDSACNLPPDFHIKNFAAKSNETGSTASLSAYNFTFVDQTTSVTTGCYFNSSSISTTPAGQTPRYACGNGNVKFIWDNARRQLTMIERICLNPEGVATYEVSGTAVLSLSCTASGTCSTNSTDYDGKYTALDPVTDPTLAKYWVS